jgi:nucleosome binding factor SPN SPT16 subunit
LREGNLGVNGKCSEVVKQGAVYYLTVGVKDIKNKEGQNMAFVVGDTVVIGKHENQILTNDIPKSFSSIFHDIPKPKTKQREPPKVISESSSSRFDEEAPVGKIKYDFKEPVKIMTRLQKLQAKDPTIVNHSIEDGKRLTDHQRRLLKDKTREMRERYQRGEFILATAPPM